jgi:hypothetical protein
MGILAGASVTKLTSEIQLTSNLERLFKWKHSQLFEPARS